VCLGTSECFAIQVASPSPSSPISVTITDQQGIAVPHAAVLIEDGKRSWKFHSDDSGKFKAELPAGTYTVTLEKTDFTQSVYEEFLIRTGQFYYRFGMEEGEPTRSVHVRVIEDWEPAGQSALAEVSDAQKKQFIKLLGKLPYKGEFYTDEAIKKAGPYLPILFALTEKDIAA